MGFSAELEVGTGKKLPPPERDGAPDPFHSATSFTSARIKRNVLPTPHRTPLIESIKSIHDGMVILLGITKKQAINHHTI